MTENINASLRMRQEKDNELAEKILKNEGTLNRVGSISPKKFQPDLPATVIGDHVDLIQTPITRALQNQA